MTELKQVLIALQSSAEARRKREKNFLEDLDETLVDKIENALDDHEARTRFQVFHLCHVYTLVVLTRFVNVAFLFL